MSHRKFTDENGTSWQVWDVLPHENDRRTGERRVMNIVPDEDRRDIWDRRGGMRPPIDLPPELLDGWLVFTSEKAKRRFWPVPKGWECLPLEDLRQLCKNATVVAFGNDS